MNNEEDNKITELKEAEIDLDKDGEKIIGGNKLNTTPLLTGAITVAAYSYMSLVPIIQPPIKAT